MASFMKEPEILNLYLSVISLHFFDNSQTVRLIMAISHQIRLKTAGNVDKEKPRQMIFTGGFSWVKPMPSPVTE